jgi:hypothetical protein
MLGERRNDAQGKTLAKPLEREKLEVAPDTNKGFFMSKVFNSLVVIAFIIGTSVFYSACSNIVPTRGNGNLVTSQKSVSAFDKISCAGSAEIRFHSSDEYRAVITVDENLDEYVEISTNNGVLNIGTKKGYNCSFTKFLVEVYCPILTGASMTGSGSIAGKTESDSSSAKITGSGSIVISGTSKDADITITGSGNFNGNGFNIKNASVKITGSGNANISVEDNLKANITGSGGIKYRGEPKVDSKVTGSGRITKI